jgi:osmoprotectant transport system permease protein
VLTNTVVGLLQVDPALIEAARGMGMSAKQTLLRVEIPLAVPVMVAGIRVALVLNVGTATLATFIGAGASANPSAACSISAAGKRCWPPRQSWRRWRWLSIG